MFFFFNPLNSKFLDSDHCNRISELQGLWKHLDKIEELASKYSISDIAQDNNLKLLQTLVLFNFENQPGREGSDAIDRYGNEWELKTLNKDLVPSFSTNHHTNYNRINAFRKERWLFSVYSGITLQEVYAVSPKTLEVYFSKWEKSITEHIKEKHDPNYSINNPKIPLKFVEQKGIKVFSLPDNKPALDPAEVLKNI